MCYYYHQDVRIVPYELRGLLLRVKNVGIGTYENSFSKLASESPVILNQLTGELYIDEGLDTALNIDRNSFFESDEAYQRLWLEILAWMNPKQIPHDALKYVEPEIHPVEQDIRRRLDLIRRNRKNEKNAHARENLTEKLAQIITLGGLPTGTPPELTIQIDPRSQPHVDIRTEGQTTLITMISNRRYSFATLNILILILTTQKVAMIASKGSLERFESVFSTILRKVRIT
jgi:hypothetical protein